MWCSASIWPAWRFIRSRCCSRCFRFIWCSCYGLGSPDAGLFVGTYVGYWFVGLAMLSIGMVASFLTSNLTVGFILGMVFNAPLAMFGVADWIIKNPQLAQVVKRWSALEQFRDFERGVISLSGISYFVMIAIVMLYISMVLIGRRHWGGREEEQVDVGRTTWPARWGSWRLRSGSICSCRITMRWRADMTSENLNSLSPRTVELVQEVAKATTRSRRSRSTPTSARKCRPSTRRISSICLSTLTELSSLSGGKIVVDVHEIENFSEEATQRGEGVRHRAA